MTTVTGITKRTDGFEKMSSIDLIYKRAQGYQWSKEGKVKNLSDMTHPEILEALMNSIDMIVNSRSNIDEALGKIDKFLDQGK